MFVSQPGSLFIAIIGFLIALTIAGLAAWWMLVWVVMVWWLLDAVVNRARPTAGRDATGMGESRLGGSGMRRCGDCWR